MNTLEFHRIVLLLDYYQNLLTKKQNQIMKERYLNDYSLSEIAERLNISRSAVLDSIQKTIEKLETFERHLNLLTHHETALKTIEKLEKTNLSSDQKDLINQLKDVI